MNLFDRIDFLLAEASGALRRNRWMTFAAVTTVAIALFLLGGMGLIYLSLNRYASALPGKFEMRVFLRDGLSRAQISEAAEKIRALDGVKNVHLLPKEQAWANWQKRYPEVTQGLENPLPDALRVRLAELDQAQAIASQIEQMPSVEAGGVRYLDEVQQFLSQAMRLVRWLGLALGGLMLLTSGVLIYNAIRLTIIARAREIKIMQLVGATRITVALPLLIEGVLQGAIGGLLAGTLLWSSHRGLERMLLGMNSLGRIDPFPVLFALTSLTVVGAAYGLVCSLVAAREPWRMR